MKHQKPIAIMLESHFDPTEPGAFTMFFPACGYPTTYISDLRGEKSKTFVGNDGLEQIVVNTDLNEVDPKEYSGIVLVGGYAMDMLRYQVHVEEGRPDIPKATLFMQKCMKTDQLLIGTICHSLWLLTPEPALLKGRSVTCSHNIMHDVRNAGAKLVYDPMRKMLADVHVDRNLVTARHPYVVQAFMNTYIDELNKRHR